ncbi:hypothetical protein J4G37_15515 [Microvirga sp. 3-52]|nr:hypothetical protein [Microvirga sp. 3-52]
MRRDDGRRRMSRSLSLPHPRHHRPCAGDLDCVEHRASRVGMAGSSPAMTGEGVTKADAGRRRGLAKDGGMLHRVITVPARSSPALAPSDVITGLVPAIPMD